MNTLIFPDWAAPANVVAVSTTRAGGFSSRPYASWNLGGHVGDDAEAVARNRALLIEHCDGLRAVQWLQQVHGTEVANVGVDCAQAITADAAIGCEPGIACAVLTADCLPVLLCDRAGTRVGAVHAGWRGLCAGVIPAALSRFQRPAGDLLAWLGPAISQMHFEVGAEVREQFLRDFAGPDTDSIDACFIPSPNGGRFMADLYRLARAQLLALGVGAVSGGEHCTFSDPAQFFSYRRDGITGRMASLIYLR